MRMMTLREIQLVSLEILKDVKEFCDANGIRYYMTYGTLLGAVRHKGFIPWDDDIDIMMLRPDYERFVREFRSDKGNKLLTFENSKSMIAYARVCDMKRTLLDFESKPWTRQKAGVYIDIFPLDAANEADFEADKAIAQKLWRKSWGLRYAVNPIRKCKGPKKKLKWVGRRLTLAIKGKSVMKKHIKMCRQRSIDKSTEYLYQLACPDAREKALRREWLDETVMLPFEDDVFAAPKHYNEVLQNQYGDYKQLPPEDKRIPLISYAKFYWRK